MGKNIAHKIKRLNGLYGLFQLQCRKEHSRRADYRVKDSTTSPESKSGCTVDLDSM